MLSLQDNEDSQRYAPGLPPFFVGPSKQVTVPAAITLHLTKGPRLPALGMMRDPAWGSLCVELQSCRRVMQATGALGAQEDGRPAGIRNGTLLPFTLGCALHHDPP